MYLFPAVKKISIHDGKLDLRQGIPFVHNHLTKKAAAAFLNPCFENDGDHENRLFFLIDEKMGEEAYDLVINGEGIHLTFSSEKGAFYGIKTLNQIGYQHDYIFPYLEIHDEPELKIRGYMLDISRNKIPKLTTLKTYVDLLAELKYNHFELYVEGLSYQYPTFESLYEAGMTPLTPKEYKSLERYAKDQMIDLVPCHNGLGHMTAWLNHYPELAILPDGMFMWGAHRAPSTVNPLDPKSLELVQSFYKDALENSSSPYFHMNLDEPYELGHGKTEEEAKKIGVGQMYLDYVLKLSSFVQSYKKTPLIWGDVLNHYPETLAKLPKDIIFVDWGYDYNYPFHKTLKRLGDLGVKFMAAPGTSSWNSITGRTLDMFENIKEACAHTKENHGLGMLLTDWGDNGHLQTFPISLPAIVYGGMESWHSRMNNRNEVKKFIDMFVIGDLSHTAGQLLLDLGSYSQFEESYTSNGTKIMSIIYAARHLDPFDLQASFYYQFRHHMYAKKEVFSLIKEQLDLQEKRYKQMRSKYALGDLIKEEIGLSIKMLKAFVLMIRMQSEDITNVELSEHKRWLKRTMPDLVTEYEEIWLKRNKKGGLSESIEPLKILVETSKTLILYDISNRNPALRRLIDSKNEKRTYIS